MDQYYALLFNLLIYIPITALILFGLYKIIDKISMSMAQRQVAVEKAKTATAILPMRIQAYERMCLFLERITPNNLLLRVAPSTLVTMELQQTLLSEIREEYNHNSAQQLYVSTETWNEINKAMNEVVTIINQSAAELQPEEPATHLAKKILAKVIDQPTQPTQKALQLLKLEFTRI
ncbi:DUF7935 family protein [Dyadobacter tibetensis]|uniref:DUF7935 family protein n=1 Tax=Dyadobacter tibetensis TaxID=1211851 RepID=UPI0004721496|nr:hypothetical protein [Dyadobacter tibetensis]